MARSQDINGLRTSSMPRTSGAFGVILDMLALLDEIVLGWRARETTLSRSAKLTGEA